MTAERARHIPVLLRAAMQSLEPCDGGCYIDGTFGAGGYTRALLEAAHTRVLAIDRDPTAIAGGRGLAERFAPRLTLTQGEFGQMRELAGEAGMAEVDGIVLDIGVSSMQLDTPERGFSFQDDGPLDMRMGETGRTAADVVNGEPEARLADVLFELGEERRSRTIARAIVKARENQSLTRTRELAEVIVRALGRRKIDGRHPATRAFQALRIFVNDELGELARGLVAAETLLRPGGRLAVVSFHSLEDRIVKRFLAARSGRATSASRHRPPLAADDRRPSFRIVNRRPLTPSQREIDGNPRARSARLRAAERTDAPAWPIGDRERGGEPRLS